MTRRARTRASMPEWRRYMRFWGRDIERDIDDELRFHLDMRQRDLMAAGMSEVEAREATLARFGDREEVARRLREHDIGRQRLERRVEIMEQLGQDIRYGARKLLQAPGFTIAVILVLAMGIGVNTAIFSAVDAALLRPLPFKDSDRLALLEQVNIPSEMKGLPPEAMEKRQPDVFDVMAMKDVVTGLAAYAPGGLNLTGSGEPVRVRVALATPSLFPLLGAAPALGRGFVEAEGKGDGANVVVLSDALWHRQFGGDRAIVGRTIALNGIQHTVVGVMPKSFAFPSATELWIPLTVPFVYGGVRREAIRSYLPSTIIIKLAPGVTADDANKRVRALFQPYKSAMKQIGTDALVMPLQSTMVKNRRTALLVLMGAATLVLLVACANVTNLLLSRAAARRREIAIRVALGAGRLRIVQQLLTESLLLAVLGGVAGIALAYTGLGLLSTLIPSQLQQVIPPTIDGRVLAFSLGLATITGLVFGLWPAFGASRQNSASSVNLSGGYASTAGDGASLRRLFVVSEMAFALMLLIAACLMFRSFSELLSTDAGVQVEHVASVEVTLSRTRYSGPVARAGFYDALLTKVRSTPGVEAAAAINEIPLRGEWGIGIRIDAEGKAPAEGVEGVYPQYLRVTPGYFRTMGIKLLAGRAIEEQDDSLHRAAVINKAAAEKVWPGENALGKRFAFGTMPGQQPTYYTVVGIIGDVRSQSLEQEPTPQMYLPFKDAPSDFAGIVARGTGEPQALLAALRSAIRQTDPEQAMFNLQMLDKVVAKTLAPRRTNTLLIAVFGLLAVVLAAYGVYAVIAYGVTQRTREIGIRIALGARTDDVLHMVLREGLVLAAIGIAIGLAGAWALSRIMQSLLFGVSARDPFTFVVAPLLLLALAVCASMLPARRAARTDPLLAIRAE